MRDWTLTHSLNGWSFEVYDVPRWRAFVARTGETILHGFFNICCWWGPAYRLLNWLVNVEYKGQVLVSKTPISDRNAYLLLDSSVWELVQDDDE